jgi:hypothetical protein
LETLILKLLPFGGFFAHFDLAGLMELPRAGYPGGIQVAPESLSAFQMENFCKNFRENENFRESFCNFS